MSTLEQFSLIAITHFLAVASPGPDFAIILKQSIRYNRRTAIFTSLGIAAGIIIHVTYSLVGIGLLIASDERLFTVLKFIAASYFCYIAWYCFQAKKPEEPNEVHNINNTCETRLKVKQEKLNEVSPNLYAKQLSMKKAFMTGFLINALNVKATLFFVSLFSLVILPETLLNIKIAYGAYLVLATGAWFCFVSYLLTHKKVINVIQRKSYLIDRLMGVVLLLLALQLVLSNIN